MRRFNPGNFYCGTTAEWTSCPRPVRHPDHMSGSGSDYWYGESGVVRYSDHWGSEVASCDWYLDGVARCSFDDHDGWRCGFAPWTEFELKTFEVTVYHPDLLPSESAAALGDPVRSGVAPAWRPGMADIPYASYRVRPDMIVDGCVVVAGTYVYGQINVYSVTTKSERYERSYWTRTAAGNGIGGRKAPVPYGS